MAYVKTAVAAAFAFVLCTVAGSYARAAGTAWDAMQNNSARDRVRMDALQRDHGASSSGGCNRLPAGWAALDATVDFPTEYRGYPAAVNSVELLPDGADVHAYVASSAAPAGTFVRPALRAGAMAVKTHVCGPARHVYWLVVDSGVARVAIGRVAFGASSTTRQVMLIAPPLR